jgi:chemotaxis protein CheC
VLTALKSKGNEVLKALNAQQRDTIEEVLNIGLGRAAMNLTNMLRDEVLLSASNIHLSNINTGQALDLIKKTLPGNLVSVAQNVAGDVDAIALVIFSEKHAMDIVQHMVSKTYPSDLGYDYEYEVMSEFANVILNACISAMASMMHLSLESYLPVHHMGDGESVTLDTPALPIKMLISLDVIIAQQPMQGFVSFSVNAKSLQKILQYAEQYLESEAFEWLD